MPTVLMVMFLRVRLLRDHIRKATWCLCGFSIRCEIQLCGEDGGLAVAVPDNHVVMPL